MPIYWNDYCEALADAKRTMVQADNVVVAIGHLMPSRLRSMRPYDLKRIKRELRAFNAATGKWRD